MLSVATQPHELGELEEEAALLRRYGWEADVLDRDAVRAEVASPTYLGAVWQRTGVALADPVRSGGRPPPGRARPRCEAVRAHAGDARHRRPSCARRRGAGAPRARPARHRCLSTARALDPPAGGARLRLRARHRAAHRGSSARTIGWARGQGIADRGNRFHYYRLTPDGRILFGGYEAVYRFGNRVDDARLSRHPPVHRVLHRHLLDTFPALEGIAITHAWGGPIDTCSRFCVTFGRALGGRAVYAVGYTGLGVGASRFGARTALDLLDGADTERTRLKLVRTRPLPFPPEPARWAVIQATRRALARADERGGRRGPWLRLLDRLGSGLRQLIGYHPPLACREDWSAITFPCSSPSSSSPSPWPSSPANVPTARRSRSPARSWSCSRRRSSSTRRSRRSTGTRSGCSPG